MFPLRVERGLCVFGFLWQTIVIPAAHLFPPYLPLLSHSLAPARKPQRRLASIWTVLGRGLGSDGPDPPAALMRHRDARGGRGGSGAWVQYERSDVDGLLRNLAHLHL